MNKSQSASRSGFAIPTLHSFSYLVAPLLALIIFTTLFQLWNLNLRIPLFGYNNDAFFTFFMVKNVIDSGWFFYNESLGFPHFGEDRMFLHDFPVYVEFLNFAIIKFFTFFTKDVFLITNCFFIFTMMATTATAFATLRYFKIGVFVATAISILYSFLPYHFLRGTWHLFLCNYMAAPLIILVSILIIEDKIQVFAVKKNKISFAVNNYFIITFLLTCFIALNGLYYAFYAALTFFIAWFLRGLKSGRFLDKNGFAAPILALTIFVILITLYFPALSYWTKNGVAPGTLARAPEESEIFALRIINLFAPITNHYIRFLADLGAKINHYLPGQGLERNTVSLGIVGSIGFMALLLWAICQNQIKENIFLEKLKKRFSLLKSEQNLICNLSNLNLMALLFVTVGGFLMFFILPFPMLRSHSRFIVLIAFITLFFVAIIFNKLPKKLVLIISVLGLLDQVGKVSAAKIQSPEMIKTFKSDQEFFTKIESEIVPQAKIFILPAYGFPEYIKDDYSSTAVYVHTKNLLLSYPSINGRKSNLWQQEKSVNKKTFIEEIRKEGFDGVIINRRLYEKNNLGKEIFEFERELRTVSRPLFSRDMGFEFFKI